MKIAGCVCCRTVRTALRFVHAATVQKPASAVSIINVKALITAAREAAPR
jgi:hypothetical protein